RDGALPLSGHLPAVVPISGRVRGADHAAEQLPPGHQAGHGLLTGVSGRRSLDLGRGLAETSPIMKGWDGESFVSRRDVETNAWMFVALHSSRLGPSTGGTRMIPYDDLGSARRDAMRLSEGMTFKWAAAGFPRGGGKGVIAAPPGLDVRARAAV